MLEEAVSQLKSWGLIELVICTQTQILAVCSNSSVYHVGRILCVSVLSELNLGELRELLLLCGFLKSWKPQNFVELEDQLSPLLSRPLCVFRMLPVLEQWVSSFQEGSLEVEIEGPLKFESL